MRVAILSPLVWRTPPRHYGPWEQVASNLAEGLHANGCKVTLFASGDSRTQGELVSVSPVPYGEHSDMDPKVWECLHIAKCMEESHRFDIIHNQYDFLPLTYSGLISTPMVTTIHGFSSEKIIEVYRRYNAYNHYISISYANRHSTLEYAKNIYHGIDYSQFSFREFPEGKNKKPYLLYFGRIHPDKGTADAITIAKKVKKPLIIAGLIQDQIYFEEKIASHIDGISVIYVGNVGPDERNKLLGNAEALLHPVYFEEPFGLSVIESWFCGTPVIAYARGSMKELIEDGVNGFLVTNIQEAVQKVGKIHSISRRNCRLCAEERFSVHQMVENHLKLYNKILSRKM